ncbi:MAG: aminoacyl-tRNA hydrolase [Ignavibacteriae bacterium]|nr:aminoacyl-tRNA hydrolase [Ignavibacteriota bacterium]
MNDRIDSPLVIAGLGNPGFEYEQTRHNLGFMVVDKLCQSLRAWWRPGKGEYVLAVAEIDERTVLLVKPLTYMNNSGEAVRDVLERFDVPISNLLVVVDDLAIELGTLRVRAKGSDGGHNGLRSIIFDLNTHEFARIRCGIKQQNMPPKSETADFVLSPFDEIERESVVKMVETAAEAASEFVRSGIGRTMTKFNVRM